MATGGGQQRLAVGSHPLGPGGDVAGRRGRREARQWAAQTAG